MIVRFKSFLDERGEELEIAEQRSKTLSHLPERWLRQLFSAHLSDATGNPIPFTEHHDQFWTWVWNLERGSRPPAFIGIWPRGGGKSSSAELGCAAIAARGTRRYVLYMSATQPQADDHVQNVAALFESPDFAEAYPDVAQRRVGKYGSSLGWRRNRIRTASGFTVDAIGLDTAARGVKLESARPDLIILDDIDDQSDSATTVEKKIATLTRTIIPTGSSDLAVLAIQNLQHPDSIFSRMEDGRADFLTNRIVSGPVPALTNFSHHEERGRTIVEGEPTWAGQSLPACQALVDDIGLQAFQAECQQNVSVLRDHIFDIDAWWGEGRNRFSLTDRLRRQQVYGYWLFFDTALKDGEENDFTACSVWEVTPGTGIRLREQWKAKLQYPQLIPAIENTAERYYHSGLLRGVVIEDKVSGTSAIQTLQSATGKRWLAPLIRRWPLPGKPMGSKEERARTASVWCSRSLVKIPFSEEAAPWVLELEADLKGFPHIPHKDVIDTFTMGILYLRNHLGNDWARQLAGGNTPHETPDDLAGAVE